MADPKEEVKKDEKKEVTTLGEILTQLMNASTTFYTQEKISEKYENPELEEHEKAIWSSLVQMSAYMRLLNVSMQRAETSEDGKDYFAKSRYNETLLENWQKGIAIGKKFLTDAEMSFAFDETTAEMYEVLNQHLDNAQKGLENFVKQIENCDKYMKAEGLKPLSQECEAAKKLSDIVAEDEKKQAQKEEEKRLADIAKKKAELKKNGTGLKSDKELLAAVKQVGESLDIMKLTNKLSDLSDDMAETNASMFTSQSEEFDQLRKSTEALGNELLKNGINETNAEKLVYLISGVAYAKDAYDTRCREHKKSGSVRRKRMELAKELMDTVREISNVPLLSDTWKKMTAKQEQKAPEEIKGNKIVNDINKVDEINTNSDANNMINTNSDKLDKQINEIDSLGI